MFIEQQNTQPTANKKREAIMEDSQPVPSWFSGCWKREWIRRNGGPPDGATAVRNIQTPTLFGDVRIPDSRPRFPHAKSLKDLTDQELTTLYSQQGFSGFTSLDGYIATWHHQIDYQPPDGTQDIGRIEQAGGSNMYEHGLDDSYLEHWWYLSSGDGRFLGVKVLRRDSGTERVDRILSVTGDHFIFARNRTKDLPMADSLASLIAKTHASRATILEYLDCEVSHGFVQGGKRPWEIQYSTMPWKEGTQLDFVSHLQVDPSTGTVGHRGPVPAGETWLFPVSTMKTEDLLVLLPPSER